MCEGRLGEEGRRSGSCGVLLFEALIAKSGEGD